MSEDRDRTDDPERPGEADEERPVAAAEPRPARAGGGTEGSVVPSQLGAQRYVMAGFFACGILAAAVVSKMVTALWNHAADNAWISTRVSFLSRIAEDDRGTWALGVGAVAGAAGTWYAYRREDVRAWTGEVASELSKVTWPTKKEVTNSTMVVIAASAVATIYLALLDRFWGFVTNLVYGI